MKILHVIPSVGPARGGPSQAILQMVASLKTQGVFAEIATTNDNGPDLLDVPLKQLSTFQDVPVWFFPRFSPSAAAVREFAFSASFTRWLWQSINQYDLIHVHAIFSYVPTVAMTIARLRQVPYVVRPLGQLCEWSLQQSALRKQIYLNLIESANLNHSQAIHFTSQQEKAEAASLGLTPRSVVIPHGLSMPLSLPQARQQLRQTLNCSEELPIILFLSRLHPKKGLDYLIPALGKLLNYPFIFAIAGNGDPRYEAELRQLVAAHCLTERTRFLGFVAGDQKDLLLQGSDLFALTSYSENFGLVVLEAMAAGLPVMLTPGVALAETARQKHLGYFPDLDVADITKALLIYLEDRDTARAIGKCARQFVYSNYNWKLIATQLIEIYATLLSKT